MAADAERMTRIETRVDGLSEKTNQLQGAYAHLASKEDIADLRGQLRGEIRGMKVGLWVVGAVLVLFEVLGRFNV